ncbi:hypothetical protein ABIE85_001874 [Bradyrhizobium diazoefficiens]
MGRLQQPGMAWAELKNKLREGMVIWITLGGLFILWLAVQNVSDTFFSETELKDRVRWYGILLEIGSIMSIAWELNKSLLEANRTPLLYGFLCWVGEWRFIGFRRSPRSVSASAILRGVGSMAAVGTSIITAGTLEERVAHLQRTLQEVQATLGRVSLKVDASEREFRKLLEQETAQRAQALSTLRENLERQALGDIRVQVAALMVLILSIFFANAPDEFAVVFNRIGLGGKGHWL